MYNLSAAKITLPVINAAKLEPERGKLARLQYRCLHVPRLLSPTRKRNIQISHTYKAVIQCSEVIKLRKKLNA